MFSIFYIGLQLSLIFLENMFVLSQSVIEMIVILYDGLTIILKNLSVFVMLRSVHTVDS